MGRGKAVVISHGTMDRVMAHSPDAFYLLMILKRYHWGGTLCWPSRWRRDGLAASEVAKRPQYACQVGLIACLHEGGLGPNDPPIYAWADLSWRAKVCVWDHQ